MFLRKRPLFCICIVLSTFIILFISPSAKNKIVSYEQLDGHDMLLHGYVNDIQYQNENGKLKQLIYLDNVIVSNISHPLSVICYTKSSAYEPKIGAYLEISGTIKCFKGATNEGMFDALLYYNTVGMAFSINNASIKKTGTSYSKIRQLCFNLRKKDSLILSEFLPSEDASIMKTMLLGEKWQLSKDIKELYQRNGIAHILAISGLHISLIGSLIFKLLKRLGITQRPAIFLSISFMFSYGLLTGFPISAVRAILMYTISMVALCIKRTPDLMTSVSFVLFLTLLKNPLFIYNSGYVFSFGCVLGIAVMSPTLSSDRVSDIMSFISKILLSPLTMLVITIPLYYLSSYQIPVYSILLNFLVIPTMSILFPAGIVLVMSSRLIPFLSKIAALIITGILSAFFHMAEFFEKKSFHYYTPGKASNIQLVIFILSMFFLMTYSRKIKKCLRMIIILLSLLILTIRIRPSFEISFLDVGQGDCIFLRACESRIAVPGISSDFTMLIDCGSSTVNKVGTYRLIPFLKYKGAPALDAVLITHPDKDHMNGVQELIENAALQGLKIKSVFLNKPAQELIDDNYLSLVSLCNEQNIPIYSFYQGNFISYKNLYIEALSPDNGYKSNSLNEASIVLYLKYRELSALLTGDIEGASEDRLCDILAKKNIDKLTILKVAHHGSKYSSSLQFLSQCKPEISVISVDSHNSYGHPHPDTITRLDSVNTKILKTSDLGQIRFTSNGRKLFLDFFQKPLKEE